MDEADFLMIDEARVPLVIAAGAHPAAADPYEADRVVRLLQPGEHFTVTKDRRNIHITPSGHIGIERLTGCSGIHEDSGREVFASVYVALHAHYLLVKDVDYIVKDKYIELVDEFTGRLAEPAISSDHIRIKIYKLFS